MALCCDLQVDINGEEIFIVDKKLLSSHSGKLSKLFSKSTTSARNFKVLFNDFPGGPQSFELISRFCYNNGKIDITPYNILLLYSAAQFLEMKNSINGTQNLVEKTEKYLLEIKDLTWSELLIILRQCQSLLPSETCVSVLQKCVDSLVGRIALSTESSPCLSNFSPESSAIRFSIDTRSTESLKNSFVRGNWWFDDLLVLSTDLVEVLVKSMVLQKLDHSTISRFLLYYQKSKFNSSRSDENRKLVEIIINWLHILDWDSVSCKNLFGILRVSLSLNISKCCRNKLENMIGSQMDRATLDNLLIPTRFGMAYMYDVNVVLRFVKGFLGAENSQVTSTRLKKVGKLMDLYITEVAADPCLKPSKFLALVRALPDFARHCCDDIYRATDIYLEAHSGLSIEEKTKICCTLNYEKLSPEACKHLFQNKKFSPRIVAQALKFQQIRLKGLIEGTNNTKCHQSSPGSLNGNRSNASNEIVLYAGKLEVSSDNEKLKAHLEGMQWRVMELEKECRKMQSQMTKIMKSKVPNQSNNRSLPRLCS